MEEPNCVADVGRPTRGRPRIARSFAQKLRVSVGLKSEQRLTRQ